MSKWDNIRKIGNELGSQLDTEAAWERFEKKKEKKKKPFWLLFFLLPLIAIGAWIVKNQITGTAYNKIEVETSPSQLATKIQTGEKKIETIDSANKTTKNSDLVNKAQINTRAEQAKKVNDKISTKNLERENRVNAIPTLESENKYSKQSNSDRQIISNAKESQLIQSEEKQLLQKTGNRNRTALNNRSLIHLATRNSNQKVDFPSLIEAISLLPIKQDHQIIFLAERDKKEIPEFVNLKMDDNLAPSHYDKTWAASVSSFIGKTNRKLLSTNSNPLRDRQDIEEMKELIGTELLLSRKMTPRFSMSLGIGLQQYRSRSFEVSQEITPFQYENVVIERFTQAGVTTEERGNARGSRTLITEHTRFQRYMDVYIPLELGFTLIKRKKVSLTTHYGLNYSIIQMNKGQGLADNINAGDYRSLEELGYRKSGLIAYRLGLSSSLKLGSDLSLETGLRWQSDLNSRLEDGQGSDDKFHSLMLQVGISKSF